MTGWILKKRKRRPYTSERKEMCCESVMDTIHTNVLVFISHSGEN